MLHKLLKEETGYSLVEVIVSIFILAIAIIPMVGMFDMGLRAATSSGNYDAARALANTNLDKVRSAPWTSITDATGTYEPTNAPINAANTAAGQPVSCSQGIFTCSVTTQYLNEDLSVATDGNVKTKVQVVVTVTWGNLSFTTSGIKTR